MNFFRMFKFPEDSVVISLCHTLRIATCGLNESLKGSFQKLIHFTVIVIVVPETRIRYFQESSNNESKAKTIKFDESRFYDAVLPDLLLFASYSVLICNEFNVKTLKNLFFSNQNPLTVFKLCIN